MNEHYFLSSAGDATSTGEIVVSVVLLLVVGTVAVVRTIVNGRG